LTVTRTPQLIEGQPEERVVEPVTRASVGPSFPAVVLELQRSAGNHAVTRAIAAHRAMAARDEGIDESRGSTADPASGSTARAVATPRPPMTDRAIVESRPASADSAIGRPRARTNELLGLQRTVGNSAAGVLSGRFAGGGVRSVGREVHCACGGTVAEGGECAECRAARLSKEREAGPATRTDGAMVMRLATAVRERRARDTGDPAPVIDGGEQPDEGGGLERATDPEPARRGPPPTNEGPGVDGSFPAASSGAGARGAGIDLGDAPIGGAGSSAAGAAASTAGGAGSGGGVAGGAASTAAGGGVAGGAASTTGGAAAGGAAVVGHAGVSNAEVAGGEGGSAVRGAGSGPGAESARAGGVAAPGTRGAIDASSGPALLTSLAATPASAFGAAVGSARGAATAIQSREQQALTAALPEIEAPTGLAPTAAGTPPGPVASTELPSRAPPEAPAPGARVGAPPDVAHPAPAAPVPASRPASIAPEPAAAASEEGGGWWDWLTGGIRRFFGGLPTSDPAVSTDAGPRPTVDLTGDADPSLGAAAEQTAATAVAADHAEADQATSTPFGEQDVRPTVEREMLRPKVTPSGAPGGAGGTVPSAPPLSAEMLAGFDAAATPQLAAKAQPHVIAYGEQQAEYERSTVATQEDGQRQIAEADAATQREQEGLRAEVRADVAGERERWRAENAKINERFGTQASSRRTAVEQQIDTKVKSTHAEAAEKLTGAEQEAASAKSRAESEAAAKKQEEESKPKSWWERAKGAVSSVFDAIRSVVSAIFDKLRQAVKAIIEAAKSVVRGLIEAARLVVVGLIKAFGEFVKGLVTIALAAFPEAAKRAREWIDRRVEQATDAVNKAAEALKNAATRILDAVGSALDAALGLLQKGLLAALDVLEALALAPFEAIELLAKIAKWIEENTHFIETAQRIMDDPDTVIEAIKSALGAMIAAVPEKALQALDDLAGQLGPKAQKHERGIRKYLSKALEHLRASWWEELKKMGWTLLWPWPAVWKDVKEIGAGIPKLLRAAFSLHVSEAIDEFLNVQQKLNSILGAVYGWFFIASVLVGAIIGGVPTAGAGAAAGALAGAAFAGEVGEALVIALIATEGAIILKSTVDLALDTNTEVEDETDYEKIAGSTLTIAITGAMMLLGELAADLAKAIWNGAKGLFRGAGADAAADAAAAGTHGVGEGPKVDAPEGRATDTPGAEPPEGRTTDTPGGTEPAEGRTTDTPGGTEPAEGRTTDTPGGTEPAEGRTTDTGDPAAPDAEVVNGEKVVASEPTADGHQAKVTEEGTCLICSTCEEVGEMFKTELDADADLRTEFDSIGKEADPAVKAERLAAFEKDLMAKRANMSSGGPGADTPGAETDTPAAETDTPAAETDTPAAETDTPAAETDTPATETDTPATDKDKPGTEPPEAEPPQPDEPVAAGPDAAKQLTVADVTPGMEVDPTQAKIFRGGSTFEAELHHLKINKKTGQVQPTHGLSLDISATSKNVASRGAHQIKSIPSELKIIQRGGNINHFEVVPRAPMTVERFQGLLRQIELW
jgi:hypothetical protein